MTLVAAWIQYIHSCSFMYLNPHASSTCGPMTEQNIRPLTSGNKEHWMPEQLAEEAGILSFNWGDFIVCACELWEVSSYPLRKSTGSNTISVLQSDISCYPLIRFGAHMRTDRHTSLTLCVCVCFFFLSNLKNTIYTTQKNNCIIVMLTFLPMGAVVQPLNQCSRSKWGLISGSHIKSRLLIYCHVRAVCHCIFPFIFNYHKAENKMMKVI